LGGKEIRLDIYSVSGNLSLDLKLSSNVKINYGGTVMAEVKDHNLEVPYYSQFYHIKDPFWMPRACGMACVKMVLDFYKIESLSLIDLIKKGSKEKGYGPSGWFHDYFVELIKGYGLNSHRKEGMGFGDGIEELANYLDDNPIIISATKFILGQKKFHMVVLTGYRRKNREVQGFYFHDPESTGGDGNKELFVGIDDFFREWRRMAIFISPKVVIKGGQSNEV